MRVIVYENGDLGVGDVSGQRLTRVTPDNPAFDALMGNVARGELEAITEANATAPPPESSPVTIREHGELGPVLTDPAHEFTGPDDIASGDSGRTTGEIN